MAVAFHLRRQEFLPAAIALSLILSIGCADQEQIHSYSAPKEIKPVAKEPAAPAKPGEVTDRMLIAILPAGDQAWFFKAVGPIAEIDKREKEINEFFSTVRVGDDGKPKWQLPEGWKETAGNSMRFATILIPTENKPLELTVNSARWTGTPADVLSNVNRWRGQLQLKPIAASQLSENTHETKAGDLPLTIVDLRGHFASSGMTPPFAGGPAGQGPASGNTPPSGLPPGHPPIDSAAPPHASAETTPPPAADTPKFTAPADWKVLPAGGFRKAAFGIGDEQHGALVTLISFPASEGPMIADPLQNVNRWRREVGLPEVKQDELAKATESLEIDGKPATFVPAVPEASATQSKLATLAAMLQSGDQIWFVKLSGDRSVVAAQQAAFKSFLKSLRFAADGGATDGHK
jgi:hypothetical protein